MTDHEEKDAKGERAKCDCSVNCGDDPRVLAGRFPMCDHGQKLAAERQELLERQAENAEIIAVHDKLQAGRLGVHPLIAAMRQVASGASADEAMRGLGYVPERQVPKWVSVEESLPVKNTEVLIAFRDSTLPATGQYTASKHNTDGWCFPGENDPEEVGPITHWMPLPDPPTPTFADRYSKPDRAPGEDGFTYG